MATGGVEEVHTTLLGYLTELGHEALFLGEDDTERVEEVFV